MKRALCVAFASPVVLAASFLLTQCSSSSTPVTPSVDAGKTDTGSSSVADSATATDTGSAVDSNTAPFEAGPCAPPEGGAPCDPGNVECNTMSCAVPANSCCVASGDAGAAQETCATTGTSCNGLAMSCDESADCTSGVCCLVANSAMASGVTVSCMATCTGGLFSIQICKSDNECVNRGPCVVQSCTFSGTTITLEACGDVPTCTPM